MIEMRFVGNLAPWLVLLVASLLSIAAWWLYRRQLRLTGARGLSNLLPYLRATAVFLAVLLLIEPVLHHRTITGQVARLLILLDSTPSMGTTDEQSPARTRLRVAEALGWLDPSDAPLPSADFADELRHGSEPLSKWLTSAGSAAPTWESMVRPLRDAADGVHRRIGSAEPAQLPLSDDATDREALAKRFRADLLDPLEESLRSPPGQDTPRRAVASSLLGASGKWADRFSAFADTAATAIADKPSPVVAGALRRFNETSRLNRANLALSDAKHGLVPTLGQSFEVSILSLRDDQALTLWSGRRAAAMSSLASSLPTQTQGLATDLSTALAAVVDQRHDTRTVVLMVSDGRHNLGPSPLQPARILGARGVPVFTLGLGPAQPPRDLAIIRAQAPGQVFMEDMVTGELTLSDSMPAGTAFELRCDWDGQVLWRQPLITTGQGRRTVPFAFPVKAAIESRLGDERKRAAVSSVPMSLSFSTDVLPGEKFAQNNATSLEVRAVTRRRTALLLDGRPRWEFRYLRNMLERDPRWSVVAADAQALGPASSPGTSPLMAALTARPLPGCDLLVIGDVTARDLPKDIDQQLRRFVASGGALLLIDGQRQNLREWAGGALSDLLPVSWGPPRVGSTVAAPQSAELAQASAMQLRLTDQGKALAALRLSSDAAAPTNAGASGAASTSGPDIWPTLPGPRFVSPLIALPGAQVLIEAVDPTQPTSPQGVSPALVWRRFGAGRVAVMGFDETWRWRMQVAEKYQLRYWNQLAQWLMDDPYAVQSSAAMLDVDAVRYEVGKPPLFRVKLLDAAGQPRTSGPAPMLSIDREGVVVGSVALSPDADRPGVYRGQGPTLLPGRYRVALPGSAGSDGAELATTFVVQAQASAELSDLSCDESLLRSVAELSGGRFVTEEQAASIPSMLERYREGKIVWVETPLSQSWWLFVPIIVILTFEWLIRRRGGLL
jgi:hypothetical protein